MQKMIKVSSTVCQICGKDTDWDSSYGIKYFITCPTCFDILNKKFGLEAHNYIWTIGQIRMDNGF